MSRCDKCFTLYASEWQSNRCCPQPIRMFRPMRSEQTNHYIDNDTKCEIPVKWMIILSVLIALFINPILSIFIIMMYFICIIF